MIFSILKSALSERRIEQLRRFKNLQKSSVRALRSTEILPQFEVQIGSSSFGITYISQIPLVEWLKIVSSYELMTLSEKEQAKTSLIESICREPHFLHIISQPYLKNIITNKELYATLLGASLYVNGNIQEAYQIFTGNTKDFPTAFNFLLAYRAAVMLDDDETTALEVIRTALNTTGNKAELQLCLAASLYRTFKTADANEALEELSKDFVAEIRNFPLAGTPAKNLELFDREIKTAIEKRLTERQKTQYGDVGDTYSEDSVTAYWNQLYYAFNCFNRYQHGWGNLAFVIEQIVQDAIDNNSSIHKVIDFGTFCATPLYKLSKANPGLKFYGVDREVTTKTLNDRAFHNKNLEFIAGDLVDMLRGQADQGDTLLFHSRTTTLIYPEQVQNIYKTCAANGVRYIVAYENFALSRTHLRYFDFDNMPAEAIPYGSVMIIHNYPKYLREAGYEVVMEKRLPYADLLWTGKETLLGDAHGFVLAKLTGSSSRK